MSRKVKSTNSIHGKNCKAFKPSSTDSSVYVSKDNDPFWLVKKDGKQLFKGIAYC